MNVVLDGQSSQFYFLNAGVPQGSVLRSTLFLIYINDLPDNILSSFIDIFADDSTIYSFSTPTQSIDSIAQNLSSDLASVMTRGEKWLVVFNATKTKSASFHHHRHSLLLCFINEWCWSCWVWLTRSPFWLDTFIRSKVGTPILRELRKMPPKWLDPFIYPEIFYLLPSYIYTRVKSVLLWNIVVIYGLVLSIILFLLLTPSNIASQDWLVLNFTQPSNLSLIVVTLLAFLSSTVTFMRNGQPNFTRSFHHFMFFVVKLVTPMTAQNKSSSYKSLNLTTNFTKLTLFPAQLKLWNSLPPEAFTDEYIINKFKSNANRFLLTLI